jgi:trans-aconitate methyltransferase
MSEERWARYYAALEGRPPRPLFLQALRLFPEARPERGPRVAVDLGCGDGTETRELLGQGWRVVAIDSAPDALVRVRASVPVEHQARLTATAASFTEVELPPADLVYAGFSLPFCAPGSFRDLWLRITSAVRDEGLLACHLYGRHDSWAGDEGMTFLTRAEVDALLVDFHIALLHEQDEDGDSFRGRKHWHVFHLIAQKATGGAA